MADTIASQGAGAGGTRNISGTNHLHVELERELADLHGKGRRSPHLHMSPTRRRRRTLASRLPGCVVFSDAFNHASMIAGIRNSRAPYHIFRHNDPEHLREKLAAATRGRLLVAFESVYSMDGDIAPIAELRRGAGVRRADLLDEVRRGHVRRVAASPSATA